MWSLIFVITIVITIVIFFILCSLTIIKITIVITIVMVINHIRGLRSYHYHYIYHQYIRGFHHCMDHLYHITILSLSSWSLIIITIVTIVIALVMVITSIIIITAWIKTKWLLPLSLPFYLPLPPTIPSSIMKNDRCRYHSHYH